MTGSSPPKERRAETRQPSPPVRIAWARDRAAQTCGGWVRNVASSGIAFTAPTRDRLVPGQTIDLTFDPGGPDQRHRRLRVVRTAPDDRFFSVIGCKSEPSGRDLTEE
jgi:hypothetical protein